MSVSDDIGSLVLMLSEHMMQRYDSEAPRKDREKIERYFEQMEYLLRHTKNPVAFSEKLPPFQRSVAELTRCAAENFEDAMEFRKMASYFITAGVLCSGAISVYSFFAGQGEAVAGGLVATACLLAGQGYMCMKQHNTRNVHKQVVRCNESANQASPDLWREAFTHYHPMMSEDIVDFRYLFGPTMMRREKNKAKV